MRIGSESERELWRKGKNFQRRKDKSGLKRKGMNEEDEEESEWGRRRWN